VISPAGMLVGGNAGFYLQQLAFDRKNGGAYTFGDPLTKSDGTLPEWSRCA